MEAPVCDSLISDDDVQCGRIYLSEPSKMLKFFCVFCEKIFDDINCYCDHLSDHVYGVATATEMSPEAHRNEENSENKDQNVTEEFGIENQTEAKSFSFNNNQHIADELVDPAKGTLLICNKKKRYSEHSSDDGYIEERLDDELDDCRQILIDHSYIFCDDDDNEDEKENVVENEEYIMVNRDDESTQVEEVTNGIHDGEDIENLIETAEILKLSNSKTPLVQLKRQENTTKVKIFTIKNQTDELVFNKNPSVEDKTEGNSYANRNNIKKTTKIIGDTIITTTAATAKAKVEYECPECEMVFRHRGTRWKHVNRVHRNIFVSTAKAKIVQKCPDCEDTFYKPRDLQDHIQKVHYPSGFQCRLCCKTMRTMPLLQVHINKVHIGCRICGRTDFESDKARREHQRSHDAEQTFKCYICGRRYFLEINLKQHMQNHADRIPESCVVCGKVTLRLTQHMKVHSPRPTRLLQCHICNKTFAFSSALSRHKKDMHKLPRTKGTNIVRKDNSNGNPRRRQKPAGLKDSIGPPATNVEEKADVELEKVIVQLLPVPTLSAEL